MHRTLSTLLKLCCLLSCFVTFTGTAQTASDSFLLQLNNYRGTLQWEQSSDKEHWTNVANGEKSGIRVKPATTMYYRAKVSEAGCSPLFSDIKAVIVNSNSTTGAQEIGGRIVLPAQSTVNMSGWEINSLVQTTAVKSDSSFLLLVTDTLPEHLLFVTNSQQQVMMLDYHLDVNEPYEVSATSTAIALLITYPFLKPVDSAVKAQLISEYRSDADFPALVDYIEQKVTNGESLYNDPSNGLAEHIIRIIQKGYNAPLRQTATQRIASGDEVTVSTSLDQVLLTNTAPFNYFGSIYEKGKTTPLKGFTLTGTNVNASVIMKYLYEHFFIAASPTVSADLRSYTNPGGNFVIRLRNGYAYDHTTEDAEARYENVWQVSLMLIANLIPDIVSLAGKDKCTKALITEMTNKATNAFQASADPAHVNLLDIVSQTMTDNTDLAQSCTDDQVRKVFENVFRYLKILAGAINVYPTLEFQAKWLLGTSAIDHCKFLKTDLNIMNCFNLEPFTTIPIQTYTCDTMSLQIRAVEDKTYYPYEGNPIPDLDFVWLTQQGTATFLPAGSINLPGKTDANGVADIRWHLPSIPSDNKAAAVYYRNAELVTSAGFITKAVLPRPEILKTGDSQTGIESTNLTAPIVIAVKDNTDGLPMLLSRFNIQIQVSGGGALVGDPSATTPLSAGWKWHLGPATGKQYVTITLTSKTCDWGTIIAVFTANVPALPVVTTAAISNITKYDAQGGGNITSDGGSTITERGICWSVTSDTPTLNDPHTGSGAGNGSFISSLTNLELYTTYYVRAYATNARGTAYGNTISFKTKTWAFGDTAFGGIVFYVDTSGKHGMVYAPMEQANGLAYPWQAGDALYAFIGGLKPDVGSGPENTRRLLNQWGPKAIAAYICDTLVLNGYDDWFLPSSNELALMCPGLPLNRYYWTSYSHEDGGYTYLDAYVFATQPQCSLFEAGRGTASYCIRAARKF